jgi:hypothetical protein
MPGIVNVEYSLDLGGTFAAKAREQLAAAKDLRGGIDEATAALGRYAEKANATPAAVVPSSAAAPAASAPAEAKRPRGRPRKEVDPSAPVKATKAAPASVAVGVETGDFAFMKATKAASDLAALKGKQDKTEAYYAKVRKGEADAAKASDKGHEKKKMQLTAESSQLATLAKGAALAGGAALGVAGAGSLAKLALGYKGVMQLQGVSYRLGLSFRSLFSGVNPAPVIRAASAFAEQFKKTSVLGHALEGLFTRSFGSLFAGVEKATPYAVAFVQGLTLGFLYVENAILRVQLALIPYKSEIDFAIGATSGLETAAQLGGIALAALAVSATVAAAPFLPYAAAIGAVVAALHQLNALQKEWDDNSGSQIWSKLKNDVGITSDADFAKEQRKRQGISTGADAEAIQSKAVPAAVANGKQIAAGLAKGMDAGAADVTAAGGRLAGAADAGIRTKAKIHSPSRMTEETAGYMGDGAVVGLDKSGPRVQAAAERNLVPDVAGMGGGAGGGRGAGGGASITLQINSPLVQVNVARGQAADDAIMATAPRLLDEVMRLLALQLGVPIR